jgi:hypothetical protein
MVAARRANEMTKVQTKKCTCSPCDGTMTLVENERQLADGAGAGGTLGDTSDKSYPNSQRVAMWLCDKNPAMHRVPGSE